MFRIRTISACVIMTILFSACSDWVNVSPKDEIEADKLFKSENGFKIALIGVYSRMTLTDNYGKKLSYDYIEHLAQRYDNYAISVAPSAETRAKIYDYKNNAYAKENVNSIWKNLFGTIANLNNLLYRLEHEGKEIVLTEGYWNLIKGEALGLRAFHYFDLLRLYGPVYSEDSEMKCLPWRTEFNADQKSLEPASVIARHILEDLTQAENLLKDDPLIYDKNHNDPFMGLRRHRMNKMAVKALMARVYLWIGDKENAALKAREVIKQCGMELVISNIQDASMYDETIFCLGMDDMANKLKDDWKSINIYANELYISYDNANTVFERTTVGLNDIRYRNRYGFIHGENGLMCRKYLSDAVKYREKIPLIRLSEMYYILAESVTLEESVNHINKVRNARGISRNNDLEANDSYDEVAREKALNKEYQKDFFAEGQWFYFLKRHNCKTFWRCPVEKMNYYVLPTPDDEIVYGPGESNS